MKAKITIFLPQISAMAQSTVQGLKFLSFLIKHFQTSLFFLSTSLRSVQTPTDRGQRLPKTLY